MIHRENSDHASVTAVLQSLHTPFELCAAFDGGDEVRVPTKGLNSPRGLVLTCRQHGVYIGGFGEFYRRDWSEADVGQLTRDLVSMAQSDDLTNRASKLAALGLKPCDLREWMNDSIQRKAERIRAAGWIEIDGQEPYDTLCQKFHFTHRSHPSFQAPEPSRAISVVRVCQLWDENRPAFESLLDQTQQVLLNLLIEVSTEKMLWIAWDLNHNCYTFSPSEVLLQMDWRVWPVGLIPIHNFSGYFAADWSMGLYCSHVEHQMLFFGEKLVAASDQFSFLETDGH